MNLQPTLERTKEMLKNGELIPLTVQRYQVERTQLLTKLMMFHCTLHMMKPAEIEDNVKKLNSQSVRVNSMKSIYIICQN